VTDQALRDQLAAALAWEDAHAGLEQIVDGIPADKWGAEAPGLPYTLWQLLEHVRLTQHDILDFCRNPRYSQPRWPDDYWPKEPAPPTAEAATGSIAAFLQDREALAGLARDETVDLFARIPHGTGQTYLRQLLLAADHGSYHMGQMVAVQRVLGIWQ
jgi:uncharacterized damage-inducible protein DinB